eukprot:1159584-Pelagomonas_calceolata.AAC.10
MFAAAAARERVMGGVAEELGLGRSEAGGAVAAGVVRDARASCCIIADLSSCACSCVYLKERVCVF